MKKFTVVIPKDLGNFASWSSGWIMWAQSFDGHEWQYALSSEDLYGEPGWYVAGALPVGVYPWLPKAWVKIHSPFKKQECDCDMLSILRGAKHSCGVVGV